VEFLPSKKKDPQKEREEQGLKSKRGETSFEKLHVSKKEKKREDEIYRLLGEILSKERMKGDHIFLQCKSDVWTHPYPTHHLHLHYLLFLDFSLSYPPSLHHSPTTMIIFHTNSLEFFFAFTIYKV
jgi:hypothetical protein